MEAKMCKCKTQNATIKVQHSYIESFWTKETSRVQHIHAWSNYLTLVRSVWRISPNRSVLWLIKLNTITRQIKSTLHVICLIVHRRLQCEMPFETNVYNFFNGFAGKDDAIKEFERKSKASSYQAHRPTSSFAHS